jgi:hypothetical protein
MDDPRAALLAAVDASIAAWVVRCVQQVAGRELGMVPEQLQRAAEQAADMARVEVTDAMRALLDTDVDSQRTNPLAILRDAVRFPTRVLAAADVPAPHRPDFARHAFPDDLYDLSPATWADVDPALYEPGIVWGAWKAKVVLERRRAEGKR